LLWIAALLSPRPPTLLVLNEPEPSLHPDLLPALGQLIAGAAERTQVITVSHSVRLIDAIAQAASQCGTELTAVELIKEFGQTTVAGRTPLDQPPWRWPKR
jgi:predicted ATPase